MPDSSNLAPFISQAIQTFVGLTDPGNLKVLDFGCGSGELVRNLSTLGYDVYGCDITKYWADTSSVLSEKLRLIETTPYRLPFPDNWFEVVISTSVLEHAQNFREYFQEIHRVLQSGGYSMHLFPGKWYLPYEPHIYVPLVNWFWPCCPKWWLAIWARLGIRNEFQQGKTWQEVVKRNAQYCEQGLCYYPHTTYRQISLQIFGNFSLPMDFYILHASGKFAKLFRRLPFKRLSGWLSSQFRMRFMVQRKMVEQ